MAIRNLFKNGDSVICFASPGTIPAVQSYGTPYPDLANLRAHYNFMDGSKMFSDPYGTVPASIGDRIRVIKGVSGKGETISAINVYGDSQSPYRRADGASFGEGGVNSYLDTNIFQNSPFTVYVYCERQSDSCLIVCDADSELDVWLNTFSGSLLAAQGGGFSSGVTDAVAGFAIRGAVFNGASSTVFVNSTEAANSLTSSSWRMRLGNSSGFTYTGKIKHIFVYDGAHDLTTRNAVRAYIDGLVAETITSQRPARIVPLPMMNIGIGLHYEGNSITYNYTDWDIIRAAYPTLKLTHFFNANVYYLPGVDDPTRALITAEWMSNKHAQDEAAFHIHPWTQIIAAAGITFRDVPSYADGVTPDGSGYSVVLPAYPKADFETLVTFCLDTFENQGFVRPAAFVAGGWLMDADRWEALRDAGVLTDCSKVPSSLTAAAFGAFSYLQSQIVSQYSGITSISQPHDIVTPAGNLRSVVSSNSAIEYNADGISYQVWLDNVVDKRNNPSNDQVVFLSTHAYSPTTTSMKAVLDQIHMYASANEITINYVTATEAGQL